MQVIDCECGTTIKAANERELFDEVRRHLARDHPNRDLSDQEVRELVAARAYEASDA